MTGEAAQFLAKARKLIAEAEAVAAIAQNDAAGRAAYLAAQALIFAREGRILKTHNGVQSEFPRLTRDAPNFDGELRGFLSFAYNLKALADHETGPDSEISPARA